MIPHAAEDRHEFLPRARHAEAAPQRQRIIVGQSAQEIGDATRPRSAGRQLQLTRIKPAADQGA
jgi:hypothetical protein